jgi:hypothetical protein
MVWTAEDKAKAMVVIEGGLPLTKQLLEALNKTLAGVHSFAATHNYCYLRRQKLGLAGRTIPWLPADLAAVDAVVNSGLPNEMRIGVIGAAKRKNANERSENCK